jgi:hypothetical protein
MTSQVIKTEVSFVENTEVYVEGFMYLIWFFLQKVLWSALNRIPVLGISQASVMFKCG